jgi:hypothetical protein
MTDTKRYNRAVVIAVIGLFLVSWVMVNAQELITGAIIYISMGIMGIFLYFNWRKIRRFI